MAIGLSSNLLYVTLMSFEANFRRVKQVDKIDFYV